MHSSHAFVQSGRPRHEGRAPRARYARGGQPQWGHRGGGATVLHSRPGRKGRAPGLDHPPVAAIWEESAPPYIRRSAGKGGLSDSEVIDGVSTRSVRFQVSVSTPILFASAVRATNGNCLSWTNASLPAALAPSFSPLAPRGRCRSPHLSFVGAVAHPEWLKMVQWCALRSPPCRLGGRSRPSSLAKLAQPQPLLTFTTTTPHATPSTTHPGLWILGGPPSAAVTRA